MLEPSSKVGKLAVVDLTRRAKWGRETTAPIMAVLPSNDRTKLTRKQFGCGPAGALVAGGAMVAICSPAIAKEDQRPTQATTDIVIVGRRSAVPNPIDSYSEDSLQALGALTIGELIDRLERRNGGQPFSIIVNGRRLTDISDLREVPPEALAGVQILANTEAGKYGLTPENRVLNLELKPRFSTVNGDAGVRAPTEGAGKNVSLGVRHVRILNEKRTNGSLSLQREGSIEARERRRLLQTDKGNGPLSSYRTLLPSSWQKTITAGAALPFQSMTLNVSASAIRTSSRQLSRFFLNTAPQGTDLKAQNIVGVIDGSRSQSYRYGVSVSGNRGRLSWASQLSGGLVSTASDSRRSKTAIYVALTEGDRSALPVKYLLLATRSRSFTSDFDVSVNSPLFATPAGEVSSNLRIAVTRQGISSSSLSPSIDERSSTQTRSRIHGGLDIPVITEGTLSSWFPGRVGLTINGDVERISGTGAFVSSDASANWQPSGSLTFNVGRRSTNSLPDIDRSGALVFYTPGFLIYDTILNESALVTRISGGAPDLLSTTRSLMTIRAGYTKRLINTRIAASIEYSSELSGNPVIASSLVTPEFQRLFARRFVRNDEGRLVSIDSRPFNAVSETRDLLRSSIHLSGSSSMKPEIGSPELIWDLNVAYDLALRNELKTSINGPALNLLKTPLDGTQGTPRHLLNLGSTLTRGGINLQFNARWRSGVQIRGAFQSETDFIKISPFWTADAEVSWTPPRASSNAKTSRVFIAVNNLLNHRLSAVDATGRVPIAFQPALLDPAGRLIALRVSRNF